ncbi:hypothetical protein [Acetobacter nitrogenifigens]|nr:hypothetical protein [Acetobacter nitrogenifigens]
MPGVASASAQAEAPVRKKKAYAMGSGAAWLLGHESQRPTHPAG